MSNNRKSKETGVSKMKLLIGIGAAVSVIVIAALLLVIINLLQKEPARERAVVDIDSGGRGTLVTQDNIDEVLEELSKPIEDGSYTVKMNSNWDFASGKAKSTNAYVANSTSNKRTVYFDVVLSDTSELVHSSPYMPVGSEISNFALDEELEAGTYDAKVIYHLVDDDLNELTTATVNVTLNIQK